MAYFIENSYSIRKSGERMLPIGLLVRLILLAPAGKMLDWVWIGLGGGLGL